ncbi:hypothetical protein P9209_00595 [Prescottella defluvii]|nr:hypothetical protein P9209_00595 [Prescottella defluvii]
MVALCAAAAVWATPSAAADVVDVTIVPGLSGGPTTPYGSGCAYLVVARTANWNGTPSEQGVSFGDYNQASTFFPQNFAWTHGSPFWVTPVVFDHALALWTRRRPENTRSWRTRRRREGRSRPSP